MNINLELYRIFYTVAKYKSFSEAAKGLYISQSAVTQRINSLEKQLDCKLFYRISSGVKLTEEGRKLFDYIKDSIEIMENVEIKFNDYISNKAEKNEIRIQTTSQATNIYIYKKMINFLKQYKDFTVNVTENANLRDSLESLSNKEIDLVVFDYPYKIRKNDVETEKYANLEQVLYVSKSYMESKDDLNIYKKNDYKFILPTKGSFERERLDKYFLKNEIYINNSYEINDLNIRNFFIENNLGIGLGIKEEIKTELKEGIFIEIPLKEKLPTYDIYIAKLRNNKKIEQFVNIA